MATKRVAGRAYAEVNQNDEWDRNHYHFVYGRDRKCTELSHCPSICDCPVDECDVYVP